MPKVALGSILPKAVSSPLHVSLLFNWYPELAAHSFSFHIWIMHLHKKELNEMNGAYVTRMGTSSRAREWALV